MNTVNTGLNRETILLSGFSHLAQALFKLFLEKVSLGNFPYRKVHEENSLENNFSEVLDKMIKKYF
jgi:hypothetical protein